MYPRWFARLLVMALVTAPTIQRVVPLEEEGNGDVAQPRQKRFIFIGGLAAAAANALLAYKVADAVLNKKSLDLAGTAAEKYDENKNKF